MGIYRHFPYSNFHEMNLDYLLKVIHELEEKWDDFEIDWGKNVAEQVAAWLEAHPEVTTTVQDYSISERKLTPELLAKTIKDYYTPQMFGAKGDGITDDTEAFKELANYKPVAIPDADYVINELVTLEEVFFDFGKYTNFKPLYERTLDLDLSSITYGQNIVLPIKNSYAEGCVYLNGRYYLVCRSVTDNIPYVAIADPSTNEVTQYKNLSNVYGNANSIHTDNEFIYIDFDTGYHIKIDSNLEGEVSVFNDTYRHLIPYNNTWYAVNLDPGAVTIYQLNGYNGGVVDSWRVTTPAAGSQSASILNGILYLPTYTATPQNNWFRFIDIASKKLIKVINYNAIQEIENFFVDADGTVKACGHYYGLEGIANICTFDGVDYPVMKYVPVDGDEVAQQSNIVRFDRYNFWKVTNGNNIDLVPFDKCDILTLEYGKLAFSLESNEIAYYNGSKWLLLSTLNREVYQIELTVGGQTFTGNLIRNGANCIFAVDNGVGAAWSNFNSGDVIGQIPTKYRPSNIFSIPAFARTTGVQTSTTYYICNISVYPNGEIKLFGNQTQLRTCQFIQINGIYSLDKNNL